MGYSKEGSRLVQMSAAFSKVHGVRLQIIGSRLSERPATLFHRGGVSVAGQRILHPTGASSVRATRTACTITFCWL